MEPEAPSDSTRNAVQAEPVTEGESIDEVLTPAGAEAVSPAVPAEALVPSPPTDDRVGPSIPPEAFVEIDPGEALGAAVASDLPPGTVEFPSLPPGAPVEESPARGSSPGGVILEWPQSTAGSVATWPHNLRAAVTVMLASGFPMLIMWGPDGTQLYNDACRSVLGAIRPQPGSGRSSRCWAEICETLLEPMFQQVMSGGKPVWIEDLPLAVDRSGYFEEAYFTFSCGAIRDETGDPIGMLATFVDTTARVLGERRLRMLGELAAHASAARTPDVTCRDIAGTLESHENDIPFFLLYLVDPDGRTARLCASAGVAPGSDASPEIVDLSTTDDAGIVWPIARVTRTGQIEVCGDLRPLAGSLSVEPWSEDAQTALAVPIMSSGQGPPLGVLVAGISPRRALDDDYRRFLDLVGAQIATALSNARAYEAERQRGEALAALDRAKTAFFTHISDELRTPLTSMLGPVGDLLAGAHGRLSGDQREKIEALHSSAVHLLKLADMLLELLRIEAGHVEPSFAPTDVAAFTSEVAGAFRSAAERAGLVLTIDCQPLDEPLYVDRGMWESIVLNLVSNALKFTLEGRIDIRLRASGSYAELVVGDTGIGIAAEHIPRLFRRFYRIPDARGRTEEGSGLGLALVDEFVRIHGGSVDVKSEPGAGTSFTIRLPMGHAHLPQDRIIRGGAERPAAARTATFVEDALRWLPGVQSAAAEPRIDEQARAPEPVGHDPVPARILIADDHVDIRHYLTRLLGTRWTVEAVGDGFAALDAIRARRPDLVIADVVMPGLDGLELLRALRADAHASTIPVLLLSGRTAEGERVAGLEAGAADYVSKPFSGRELVAKVQTHIELSRLRAQADLERTRLRSLFNEAPVPICIFRGPDHVYEFANPPYARLVGNRELIGRSVRAALPELEGQGLFEALDGVYRTAETFWATERPVRFAPSERDTAASVQESCFTMVHQAMRGAAGDVEGVMVFVLDVTEQVLARRKLEEHMASRDAFFAAASHELRNPIHSLQLQLLALTRRAEREAAAPELEWVHARLGTAAKELSRLTHLVDTLLDVSRIASGRLPLVLEDVDLAEVVSDAYERLDAAEQAQITLTLNTATGRWDRLRLDQVVTNLVSNALKYGDGEPVEIVVAGNEGRARLEVTDHGIGIAPHHHERVFERFERVVSERRYTGFGLGLWITSRIVEEFGGTLSLRSELGVGSTFIVQLPMKPVDA